MIQANELRIGNFLYNKEKDCVRKIRGINEDYIFIDSHIYIFDKYSEFNPIPLTEEWLFKFGFVQDEYFKNKFDLGDINAILIKDFCIIEMFDHLIDTHVSIKQIKYVHQLQNLYFFLTGSELTVA